MSKSIFGLAQSSLIPARLRTDPVLIEERRRVRLRLRDGHPGSVASRYGWYRPDADDKGFVEHVVYVSDMAAIMVKVESDHAAVDAARRNYFRKLRELVAQASPDRRKAVEDLPDDLSVWPEWARKLEARCALSIEAEFHAANGRGIRPFAEMQIAEKLPAPETEEQQVATQHRADMQDLARILAEALPRAQPASEIATAVVQALIAAGVVVAKK